MGFKQRAKHAIVGIKQLVLLQLTVTWQNATNSITHKHIWGIDTLLHLTRNTFQQS